jgi:hypothetical protein
MAKLSMFFPFHFRNGHKVSELTKPCPRCQAKVTTSHMQGRALQIEETIFIDATGHCPQCKHDFTVACVITDDKIVHPVWLPVFFYRLWLNKIAKKLLKHTAKPTVTRASSAKSHDLLDRIKAFHHETTAPTSLNQSVSSESLPVHTHLVASDHIIGHFNGSPIPEYFYTPDGLYYFFKTTIPLHHRSTLDTMGPDEILIGNQLIYALGDKPIHTQTLPLSDS